MMTLRSIIVVQTAFIGDAVLTLPMIQRVKKSYPDISVDVITIPRTAEIFQSHPAIRNVIVYDKRHTDRGIRGILNMVRILKSKEYTAALIPHRSFRSALIPAIARIPLRIGFDKSAGAFLMTHVIPYRSDIHEIERNQTLLRDIDIPITGKELPSLYPSTSDKEYITHILTEWGIRSNAPFVAIAPGSVWATKRWPADRYGQLIRMLNGKGVVTVLVGGKEDAALCREIVSRSDMVGTECPSLVTAGRLTLLQSAALLQRARALVTNDTAPMHLAVAMRTPVVAIFGATVPAFGFSPYGESDKVVETLGLPCRPCSIHGGQRCPIKKFDCMEKISTDRVFNEVLQKL